MPSVRSLSVPALLVMFEDEVVLLPLALLSYSQSQNVTIYSNGALSTSWSLSNDAAATTGPCGSPTILCLFIDITQGTFFIVSFGKEHSLLMDPRTLLMHFFIGF